MSTLSREWGQTGTAKLGRTRADEAPQRCEDECTDRSVALLQGELSSFVVRKGDVVVCLRGAVWLTQSGDLADYVLQNGERFRAAHDGKVVIQGLSAALLCVPQTAS